jgi:pyruvate, orthophosphate dikinase
MTDHTFVLDFHEGNKDMKDLLGGKGANLTEMTLESTVGKRLGDPSDPLLVSVRSGAKFSMPGTMDTVLNLGLNEASVQGLAAQLERAVRRPSSCARRPA